MQTITAKARCVRADKSGEGDGRRADVAFGPDYGDPANKAWAAATPHLEIRMTTVGDATDLFELGAAYTVQFVKNEA